MRRIVDDFRHGTHGARAIHRTRLEVFDDLIDAPRAEPLLGRRSQAGGKPTLAHSAFEGVVLLDGSEQVLRAVAGAAMAETLDEIGAPVPLLGLVGVPFIGARLEEERVPDRERAAPAHRPGQFGRLVFLSHRIEGVEVRPYREHVTASQLRIPRVRKCRIEMRPVAPDAVVHRVPEVLFAPFANAGLAVRRDVGRIDGAERCRHGAPAGERLAAIVGMTCRAVARVHEIATAHHLGKGGIARESDGAGAEQKARRGDRCPQTKGAFDHGCTRYALMSGPGLRRYWLRIASAAQKVSAPTVPVGLYPAFCGKTQAPMTNTFGTSHDCR